MIKLIKAAALCAAFAVLLTLAACAERKEDDRVFGGAIYEESADDAAAPSERSLPPEETAAEPEAAPDIPLPSEAEEAAAPRTTAEDAPETPAEDKGLAPAEEKPADGEEEREYVLNTNSKKFHFPGCSGVSSMKEKNKQEYKGKRQEIIDMGYSPCGICKP